MDSRHDLEKALAGLPTLDADPERVERIRLRCIHALKAQYGHKPDLQAPFVQWRRRLELTAVLSLSAVYLAVAVTSSFSLLR